MKLKEVFDTESDLQIGAIMYDSRKNCPDSIFFAMKGKINDGHCFIDQAIENGAVCIVYTDEIKQKKAGIEYIRVEDATEAYVSFCNAYYGHPLDQMNVIGITGTNGKTTIAWILRSLIAHYTGCGYIGTLGYSVDGSISDSGLNLTTPKSDELFRIGKEMIENGCTTLVMEASSEGLLTKRLEQVSFSTAVFNNLSGDHFDIHGDMESYFQAKCLLFAKLNEDGTAIINLDDAYGKRLSDLDSHRHVSYGLDTEADYRAVNIELYDDHSEFDLLYQNQIFHVHTDMPAKFNIYNLLAVIAVMKENGYELNEFLPLLEKTKPTPGRCQMINAGQNFHVVVDFAFTPNSFDKVFDFAESITEKGKKIIAVFGAAGDRDHKRRPGTCEIADARADAVILTYDDPCTEDMLEILREMETYFRRIPAQIILDRREAIDEAVRMAEDGDTILLLGKGSDRFFLIDRKRVPWISDEKAAEDAIERKLQKKL